MKLTYTYTVHGFSGGRMLSNSLSGEWERKALATGKELVGPNGEVKLTVMEATEDSVILRVKYGESEKTLTLLAGREEKFNAEANAYGFTFVFTLRA